MTRLLIRWCTLAGAMAGLLALTVPASAATGWTIVTPPAGYPALAVSADSPTDIWGIYRNNQITHYNGTSWSVYTLSEPSGTAFESVEAFSPTDVWLFGTDYEHRGAPDPQPFLI